MLRYKKQFSLGNNVSFSDFLHSLDERDFVNYGVIIEKTPSENKYHFELVTHVPMISTYGKGVYGKVLLSEGEILHSEGSKNFFIRAWAKGMNLFIVWLFFILAISGNVLILYTTYTQGWQPTSDMFIAMALMFLPLIPYWMVYRQDKDIFNRIGSIGKSLEKK